MQSLQEVYNRIQDKKREYRTIAKSFQDELKNNPRYLEITDEMKRLREEKKSLEQMAKAAAALDATKMETLKLDIDSDRETLTDIALNKYVEQETVQIIDKEQNRYSPVFSVRFKKAGEGEEQLQQAIAAVEAEQSAIEQSAIEQSATEEEIRMPEKVPAM